MKSPWWSMTTILILICSALVFAGCAQNVGDIDRTQPNRLKKSTLINSDWFMAQTIVDAPTTSMFTFVGETSSLERVRWEVTRDMLVAYRAYPKIANSEAPDQLERGDDFTESPVAAYPILAHFDIQRSYNTATGEQSNLLVENMSDRPWFERDYMRVDWSRNLVTNFDFISTPAYINGVSYFVPEEQGGPDAMVREYDKQKRLNYFDMVGKIHVEPDFWGCLFSYYNWSAEDCTAAEIKVRTSFMKTPKVREYEPLQYPDRMMSKFGYFRTERFGFDPWRGVQQSNRLLLANRHPIWEQVWQRDEQGEILKDKDGRMIPLPMAKRVAKPIVYYASANMPAEIWETSKVVANSWNNAFRQTVATSKQIPLDQVGAMFVVCHNPVAADDDAICGEEGKVIRMGDIRYNHMVWVDRYTQAGLLGYGPSGADPLTGEIVFGSAFVYGTAVDSYAAYATDLVRLIQGKLTEEDLQTASYIKDEILRRLKDDPARPKVTRASALKGKKASRGINELMGKRRAKKWQTVKRRGLEAGRPGHTQQVMQKIAQSGLEHRLLDKEIIIGKTRGRFGHPNRPLDDKTRAAIAPSTWASPHHMKMRMERDRYAAKKNLYLKHFADDAVLGLARELQSIDDADEIRSRLRRSIYRAVMEHEVGHTLGLRHNFQGSYDSLNYHDQYWALRKETLILDPDIDQLYEMSTPTQAQIDGRMQDYAYSSIMDYGMRFNSDVQGIGKYDIAAIRFAYSSGTYDVDKGIEHGYVDVYEKPGDAKDWLQQFEDPPSLAYDSLLEQYHYTTVAQAFGQVEDIAKRRQVRYGDLLAQRESEGARAPVEVHYMFCSDEWIGAALSCQLFDAGADPFEMAKHTINMYREYYPLHHLSRDRVFFWSEDVFASMYSRYFSMLTHIYQQWVFAYFWDTEDTVLDNYYLFGATSGFNLMADVLMTPPTGSYRKDDRGIFRWFTDNDVPNADLKIDYASGRPVFSDFQFDSGYYYYERVQNVGHFWDFLAALFALTDSDAVRLGVDTSADEIAFQIPWYLFFEQELTSMMNGIFLKDARVFGPRVVDGKLVRQPWSPLVITGENGQEINFDPETGQQMLPAGSGDPVDLDSTFTQQLYTLLYGMAFFTSNYSLNFPDQWKLFRLGSGEQVEAADGYTVVEFEDPQTGFKYGALKGQDASGAAAIIEEANYWKNIYLNSDDEDARNDAYFEMVAKKENMDLARSLYDLFGTVF